MARFLALVATSLGKTHKPLTLVLRHSRRPTRPCNAAAAYSKGIGRVEVLQRLSYSSRHGFLSFSDPNTRLRPCQR